jgi:peptidoglycan-associated lipoprotein
MKVKKFLKYMVLASGILLTASCAKKTGMADYSDTNSEGLTAQGLGHFPHFSGQRAGESFTTQAPHNQLYLFAYDDSSLAPKYLDSLNAQAEYLKTHAGARVLITGHTDERGSREYNVALGERRAGTVAELMRMAGVRRNQFRLVSYGRERPANLGHDEASHAQNRRVEFIYESTR